MEGKLLQLPITPKQERLAYVDVYVDSQHHKTGLTINSSTTITVHTI